MRYVIRDGKLMPSYRVPDEARSSLPAPMIISDHLDDVKNPVDGKRYSSKSAYYRTVKEAGCEIVGNEAEKMIAPSSARSDVKTDEVGEALHKVKQGYKPELEFDDSLA